MLLQLVFRRRVVVEHVTHDAGAARERHEFALEADESARGDAVIEPHAPFSVGMHLEQLAAPAAKLFHDAALVDVFDVYREHLVGLAAHAVDGLVDHARPRHRDFVALAAHVLEQDGEVQLATPVHDERVGVGGILDPHGSGGW